jgi:hypothetical protein
MPLVKRLSLYGSWGSLFYSPFLSILLTQAIILLFAITTPNNYFVIIDTPLFYEIQKLSLPLLLGIGRVKLEWMLVFLSLGFTIHPQSMGCPEFRRVVYLGKLEK